MPKSWWHTHAVDECQVLGPNAGRIRLRLAKVEGLCQTLSGLSWAKVYGLRLNAGRVYWH